MILDFTKYVVIQSWAVECLGLEGDDLILFSVIYGFDQNVNCNHPALSVRYLSFWLSGGKADDAAVLRTRRSLRRLKAQGLIMCRARPGGVNVFSVYLPALGAAQEAFRKAHPMDKPVADGSSLLATKERDCLVDEGTKRKNKELRELFSKEDWTYHG